MSFRRPQYIITTAFLVSVCNGLVITTIPWLAKEQLQVSAGWLGLYGTTWAVPYIFTAWAAGPLSDRWGRRRSLMLALAGMLAGYGLVPFCIGREILLVPLILIGASHGVFWPVIEAAMSDSQRPSQIKRAAGFFNFSWMGGLIVGPILAFYLYPQSPIAPAIVAAAIATCLLGVTAIPQSLQIAPWGKGAAFDKDEQVSRSRRALFIRLAFIGNITTFFMLGAYRSLLAEYTIERGIAGFNYGLLQAALTVGMAATNLLLILWHRWHYSLVFLFVAEGAAIVFLLLFCATGYYPALVLIAVAIGFPAGVTYFSSIYYGLEQTEQKGSHSGNHEAIIGIGASTGPILGGWMIDWSGLSRGHLILCAVIFAGAIGLQAGLVWSRRRYAQPPPVSGTPAEPCLAPAKILAIRKPS